MKKLNKKAYSAGFAFQIVLSLILIIIPTYILILIIAGEFVNLITTYDLDDNMIPHRIFYSKNSIFFTDSITGRTFADTIDIEKYNENTIKALLGDKIRNYLGIKLSLAYGGTAKETKEIFYNKDFYMLGSERKDIYGSAYYERIVNVKSQDTKTPGTLILHLVYKKNEN